MGTQSSVINNANMVVLNFTKARKPVSFTIMKMGDKTNVSADGEALKVAGAKPAGGDKTAADTPSPAATADDLIVEESGGLPMPKRHTLSEGSKTPFRRELTAKVPLDIKTVLEFYRRELTKLNWKEEAKGAEVAADKATLLFVTADGGPGVLKLGRKDGETTVNRCERSRRRRQSKSGAEAGPGQDHLRQHQRQ